MNTEKRWKEIHKRLKKLNKADTEEEATLLGEAYDNLVIAYQEARELNQEMERLTLELTSTLKKSGIAF